MSEKKTNLSEMSQEEIVNLSPEKLKEIRDEQQKMMEEQMPYLETQAKFTRLKAEIAQNRLTEDAAKMKHAQLKAPAQKQPAPGGPKKQG